MDPILQLIDRFTASIPPELLRKIRLGFILIWVVAASIVVFFSWKEGVTSAPQLGQDLHQAEIKERITREQNLERRAEISIPDLQELVTVGDGDAPVARPIRPVLEETRTTPLNDNPDYLDEKREGIYPEKTYTPAGDPGVGGVRQREMDEDGIDLLPPVDRSAGESQNMEKKEEPGPIHIESSTPPSSGTNGPAAGGAGKEPALLPVE